MVRSHIVFDWGGWIRDGVGTRGVGEKKIYFLTETFLNMLYGLFFCPTSLEPDKRIQREGIIWPTNGVFTFVLKI